MKRKVLLSVLLLMALCLAVPAVNAVSVDLYGGRDQTASIGTADSVTINIVDDLAVGRLFLGCSAYAGSSSHAYFTQNIGDGSSVTVPLQSGYNSVYVVFSGRNQQVAYNAAITISYTYQDSSLDPTPVMPYISFSAYHTDPNGAYIDYNVQCVPDLNEYGLPIFYRAITFSEIDSSYGLRSAETLIQVRVFAGNPAYVYSAGISEDSAGNVLIYPFVSTMLPAPVASSFVLDNLTIKEELQNIPNPVKTSSGLVSGSWQALAIKKNVSSINTPFSEIISNTYHYFKFPEMTSPDIIKASLLNGTGNITLPLYNAVDGFTSLALLLPNYVSGILTGFINPIAETFETVKDVILTTSDYVQDAMQALYAILPFVYLFIPDFVWWGFTIYLSYLVFAWILTLLCGYDVISTYYVDPFVSWVKSRRGGE